MKKLIIALIALASFSSFAEQEQKKDYCDAIINFSKQAILEKQKGTPRIALYEIVDNEAGGKDSWRTLRAIVDGVYTYPEVHSDEARKQQVTRVQLSAALVCVKYQVK